MVKKQVKIIWDDDPHRIAINRNLDKEEQVVTTAHEAYGHANFFEEGKDYSHRYEREFNYETMKYDKVDTNKELREHIKKAEKLARKYYRARKNKK